MHILSQLLFYLFLLASATQTNRIRSFDSVAITQIFEKHRPTFFVFEKSQQKINFIKNMIQTDSNSFRPESILVCIPDPNQQGYSHLKQFLGIDEQTSVTLFLDSKMVKYKYNQKIFTTEALILFANELIKTQQPFLKSQPKIIWQDQGSHVVNVNGKIVQKSFKEFEQKQIILLMHEPESTFCYEANQIIQNIAVKLSQNRNFVFAKINVFKNQYSLWQKSIQITIPLFVFWSKDKHEPPVTYRGRVDEQSILHWIKQMSDFEWTQIEITQIPANAQQIAISLQL